MNADVLVALAIIGTLALCALVLGKQSGGHIRLSFDFTRLQGLLEIFAAADTGKAEYAPSSTAAQRGWRWWRTTVQALGWFRATLLAILGGGSFLTVSIAVIVVGHGTHNSSQIQRRPDASAHTSPPGLILTRARDGGSDSIAWLATSPGVPLVGFATRHPGFGWKQASIEWTAGARAELRTPEHRATVILASGCWEFGRPAREGSPSRILAALAAYPKTPSWLTSVAREELGAGAAVACAGKPATHSTVPKSTEPPQHEGLGLAVKGPSELPPAQPNIATTKAKPNTTHSPTKGGPGEVEEN